MDFSDAPTAPRGQPTASAKVGFERKVKITEPKPRRSRMVHTLLEFVYKSLPFLLQILSFLPCFRDFPAFGFSTQSHDWNGNIAQKSASFFYTLASCTNLRFSPANSLFSPFFAIVWFFLAYFCERLAFLPVLCYTTGSGPRALRADGQVPPKGHRFL